MTHRTPAVLAIVALVGTMLIPTSSVAAVGPRAAPPDDVDVSIPTPAGSDADGHGLLTSTADAELASGMESPRPIVEEEHGHHRDLGPLLVNDDASTLIGLPSAPDSLILRGVANGTTVALRLDNSGVWTEWMELTATADEGPDGTPAPNPGVGPIWLGGQADMIEIRVVNGPGQTVEVEVVHDIVDDQPSVTGVRSMPASAPTSVGGGAYRIARRSAWATSSMVWDPNDDSGCADPPTAAASVHGVVIHHTAGGNAYARSDVPAVIRSIYHFHTGPSRSWCDVGYNFMVDRYGGVWEARTGSIARPVVGAHTGGYNTGSVGVAILGDFGSASPTGAALHGASRAAGYAAQKYGLDPARSTRWKKYRDSSGDVTSSVISGHRNFGSTSCPGDVLYSNLPTIRRLARGYGIVPAYIDEFLSRRATAGDVTTVSSVVRSSGYKAAALDLAHSVEYAGLIIDQFYLDVLGRRPDAGGRSYWVGRLARGMRVEDVGAYFYGSSEYYTKTGGRYGYVTALYDRLLHREADRGGLNYWVSRLDAGMSPPEVSIGFYRSNESRRDRVSGLYRRFLGRGPDPGGLTYWSDLLLHTDDIELAAFLASSDEYLRKALS